jgi:preprotein translocase subunit SecE
MARVGLFKFMQEVRTEGEKVTWPTRRETAVTTVMVFIMTAVSAIFFLISDQIMRMIVTFVIGWSG